MHVPQPQAPVIVHQPPVVLPYAAPQPLLDEQLQHAVQHATLTLQNQVRMQDEPVFM